MTSPTVNSVGVTFFNPASIGAGRYVAHGEKWGGALGTGVTLTFSFLNHGTSYYAPNYSRYNEHRSSSELSNGEQAAVRAALAAWSSFANVGFRQVSDSYNTAGDLRFGYTTSNSGGEAAHAYFPSSAPIGGDVWFDWDNFNPTGLSTIARGSDDFQTILHEIGHALGLKHSFQSPNAIAAAQDNFFYSVMSYTASPWSAHGVDQPSLQSYNTYVRRPSGDRGLGAAPTIPATTSTRSVTASNTGRHFTTPLEQTLSSTTARRT